jgi:hypothetical protein
MKGMLDFLEKAGLVTRDSTEPVIDLSISAVAAPPAAVESPVGGTARAHRGHGSSWRCAESG